MKNICQRLLLSAVCNKEQLHLKLFNSSTQGLWITDPLHQKCSSRKVFYNYTANSQKNSHGEVWFQYLSHTSAWVFSGKVTAYFQNTFLEENLLRIASGFVPIVMLFGGVLHGGNYPDAIWSWPDCVICWFGFSINVKMQCFSWFCSFLDHFATGCDVLPKSTLLTVLS